MNINTMEYNKLKIELRQIYLTKYDQIVEYRLDPNQDLSYYVVKKYFFGLIKCKKKKYYESFWDIVRTKSGNYLYCNNLGFFEWLKNYCNTVESLQKYINEK